MKLLTYICICFTLLALPLEAKRDIDLAKVYSEKLRSIQIISTPLIYDHYLESVPKQYGKKLYKKPIQIFTSVFNGPVNFSYSIFEDSFKISNSSFEKEFTASWDIFENDFLISYGSFLGNTSFSNNLFNKQFHIFNVNFEKDISFYSSKFQGKSTINNVLFEGNADFSDAIFFDEINFDNSFFKNNTEFVNVIFKNNLSFANAEFTKTLNLSHVTFFKNVSFRNTRLPEMIDLSYSIINEGKIDLTHTKLRHHNTKTKINLIGADLNKITLNYADFKLYFPKYTSHDLKVQTYNKLLNHFLSTQDKKSHYILYSEFQDYLYTYKDQHFLNIFHHLWSFYGLEQGRVFIWIASVVLVLTLINTIFFETLVSRYIYIPFLKSLNSTYASHLNPFIKYIYYLPRGLLLTIFLCFASGFKFGLKPSDMKSENFLVSVYIFCMMLLGYIFLFIILNYIMKG